MHGISGQSLPCTEAAQDCRRFVCQGDLAAVENGLGKRSFLAFLYQNNIDACHRKMIRQR